MRKLAKSPHFGILWNLSCHLGILSLWDGLCHVPFKVCASWQMPSVSARATSQVALPPSLVPVGGGCIGAPFGPDLHLWQLIPSSALELKRPMQPCYKLQGHARVGPAGWPCVIHSLPAREGGSHSGPLLEHICLPHSLSNTGTACPCPCPTDILLPLLFILYHPATMPFGFSQILVLVPSTALAATYQFMCLFHQSCHFILSTALESYLRPLSSCLQDCCAITRPKVLNESFLSKKQPCFMGCGPGLMTRNDHCPGRGDK